MMQKMETKRSVRLAGCLIMAVLTAAVIVTGCGPKDDTRVLLKLIEESARQAEAHRIGDLLEITAEGFTAMPGGYNRATTRGILFRAFRYYGNFTIHYPHPAIHVDTQNHRSTATVYFIIVRQDQDFPDLRDLTDHPREWLNKAGEKADLYQLKLDWIQTDGDWRVEQAQIQGFKGTGF